MSIKRFCILSLNRMPNILFFLLFFLFSSCFNQFEKKVIATCYNKELLLSDLIENIPHEHEDSSFFAQEYINKWIRKELMLSHAEMNLNDKIKDEFNIQVNDFRESLLIHAYKEQLVLQNLDSIIDNNLIIEYYEKNYEAFILNKSIFKGRYIIVDKSAPKLKQLDRLYKSNDSDDFLELVDYCNQFAKEYYLQDTVWQYFTTIAQQLPIQINEEQFLIKEKNNYFEDDNYRYYINIDDYILKGKQSPLAFVSDRIKNVLINKKKVKYLKDLEDKLFNNAISINKIKIY